jgi:ribose 5-phosphate isomerase B
MSDVGTVGTLRETSTGGVELRIAYSADDANDTTRAVVGYLNGAGHEVVMLTPSGKWPDIGEAVGRAVVDGEADLGVVMCWTGTGTAIAANKVPGVRAALAWDPWIAKGARLWNDANVLAMSLKRLAPDVAVEVVQAFLDTTEPDPEEADNIARVDGIADRPARA